VGGRRSTSQIASASPGFSRGVSEPMTSLRTGVRRDSATEASPLLPALTTVTVMIPESGSSATWPA
jgi:undecaprenyl pyrophosphate phosphatase UppP